MPKYICLFIGPVLQLYTIESAVENIAYSSLQKISVNSLISDCTPGGMIILYLCAQFAVLYNYNCLLILIYYKVRLESTYNAVGGDQNKEFIGQNIIQGQNIRIQGRKVE